MKRNFLKKKKKFDGFRINLFTSSCAMCVTSSNSIKNSITR